MRTATILLLVLIGVAAIAQAREVASRSERRAKERARAAAQEQERVPPTPTGAPPPSPPPTPPSSKPDDDDDEDIDPLPVDPTDDDDKDDSPPPAPAAPIDFDLEANWGDTEVATSLWRVVSSGDINTLREMIKSSKDVARIRSADGRGALFWAYEYNQPQMVSLLKANGAREDIRAKDGKTPREMAGLAPTNNDASAQHAASAKRAENYRTCDDCVSAGFGWEATTLKCSSTGGSKICDDDDDDDDDEL